MPLSATSEASSLGYDLASPAPFSSSLREIYSVQVPAVTSPGDKPESHRDSMNNLGMRYSVYKYNPETYPSFQSSYSTLTGWAGDVPSRGNSPEPRDSPFAFASSSSEVSTNQSESWNQWPPAMTQSTASPNITPDEASLGASFGWYGSLDQTFRSQSETRNLQQYTEGLEAYNVNEGTSPQAVADNRTGGFLFPL